MAEKDSNLSMGEVLTAAGNLVKDSFKVASHAIPPISAFEMANEKMKHRNEKQAGSKLIDKELTKSERAIQGAEDTIKNAIHSAEDTLKHAIRHYNASHGSPTPGGPEAPKLAAPADKGPEIKDTPVKPHMPRIG